jgi:hypothetical protein
MWPSRISQVPGTNGTTQDSHSGNIRSTLRSTDVQAFSVFPVANGSFCTGSRKVNVKSAMCSSRIYARRGRGKVKPGRKKDGALDRCCWWGWFVDGAARNGHAAHHHRARRGGLLAGRRRCFAVPDGAHDPRGQMEVGELPLWSLGLQGGCLAGEHWQSRRDYTRSRVGACLLGGGCRGTARGRDLLELPSSLSRGSRVPSIHRSNYFG